MTTSNTGADRRVSYDPITLEVIRMRLDNIVEEMGIAMIRSSGSPVITEARDYNTALFDASGRIYAYSDSVQLHIGSGGVAVRELLKTVAPEDMYPGDAFISNDPHTAGSSHPPDTSVISPIFRDGTLIGFAQSQAHLVDVGGMAAGGFAPSAYDCYAEALRLPPGVKAFDRGKPNDSVRRLIANNVRTPVLYWNDVRSMVASNTTGTRRLLETIDEFGHDDFQRYTALSFELAEQVVRGRISDIPDGTWTAEDWVEGDGHDDRLHRVFVTLTVAGDQITFDFEGSAPQTQGFVNCAYGALVGSVASAVVPILAWDVPFNEGVMTATQVKAPRGSIVNPRPPAPISNGHLETGVRATRLVTRVLNEACARSSNPIVRSRCQGEWGDAWTGGITSGTRDDGEFFVWFNMDGGGMGAGAQLNRDGHDASGLLTQVGNVLPDVEMNEMIYPVLYLWKTLSPQTAGHGASRGGMGLDFAWTLWGADQATQTVFCPTASVPPWGFGGGLPAGGSGQRILRGTNVDQLLSDGRRVTADALTANKTDLLDVNVQATPVSAADVFHQWLGGGGGIGDPLQRPANAVVADVRDGYVLEQVAHDVYGVALDDSDPGYDAEATAALRDEIRVRRLAGVSAGAPQASVGAVVKDELLCRTLVPVDARCPSCTESLPGGDAWEETVPTRTTTAASRLGSFGTWVRRRTDVQVLIDEAYCPRCGSLLRASVRVDVKN